MGDGSYDTLLHASIATLSCILSRSVRIFHEKNQMDTKLDFVSASFVRNVISVISCDLLWRVPVGHWFDVTQKLESKFEINFFVI